MSLFRNLRTWTSPEADRATIMWKLLEPRSTAATSSGTAGGLLTGSLPPPHGLVQNDRSSYSLNTFCANLCASIIQVRRSGSDKQEGSRNPAVPNIHGAERVVRQAVSDSADLPRGVLQPRAQLVELREPRHRVRGRSRCAVARAHEVRRHRRHAPRRVLHEAHERVEATDAQGFHEALSRRAATQRRVRRVPGRDRPADRAPRTRPRRRHSPTARERRPAAPRSP